MTRGRDRAAIVGAELSIAGLTGLGWVLSYSMLKRLAALHGYAGWQAWLWPLTVDLLVLAATLIAMVTARRGQGPTGEAWVMAGAATAATLAGNILAAGDDPVACAMHAWPALCMVGAWHLLFRSVLTADSETPARAMPRIASVPATGVATAATVRAGAPRRSSEARRAAERVVRDALAGGREPTTADVARATSRSQRQARRLVAEAVLTVRGGSRPAVLAPDGERPWAEEPSGQRGGAA
jgi:hypothetical protein